MARKATKALEDQSYSALDAYCIALHEYYKSLRKAGWSEGLALFMVTDKESYPAWILPSPVDPNKFGDYDDEDDD
jgi:hypothetical protein